MKEHSTATMVNNSEKLITVAAQKFGQLTDADTKLFCAVARHEVANFKAMGEVNLVGASIGGQLACIRGQFSNQEGTAINANTAKIAADVFLRHGFKAVGMVSLVRASIGGQLDCSGGQFSNQEGTAINANTAKIAADVFLSDGFKVVGMVSLVRASIGGQLACIRGQFRNKGKIVINADAATIATDVYLRNGFKAVGMVNLRGAFIGGQLACIGGQFSNEDQIVINANTATIAADVLLSDGFKALGEVNLVGTSIGGKLDCSKGQFSNQEGTAINANTAKIAADVFLRKGCETVGEVNLVRASIGGQLDCSGGQFSNLSNQEGTAINANTAKIAADVFLRKGFEAVGEVNLVGVSIGGQLNCSEGQFRNQEGTAINVDAAKIAADVFLCNGFKAMGEVNLRGASIGGRLVCFGGEFSNEKKTAIAANTAKITASVVLSYGFKAVGMVDLLRASIGGNIRCTGGQFLNETRSALDAEGVKIGGSVFLGGGFRDSQFQAEGKIIFLNASIDDRLELEFIESNNSASIILDLRFAKVNTFSFKDRQAEESWIKQIKEGQLCLNGFVYSTINITNSAIKDNTLKKWLRLQIKEKSDSQSENGFFLQPYEQLAAILKANGHQKAATKVLIAKENDRRRYGGLTNWGKVWNRILGVTIAHGYRPQNALIYSALVMVVGWRVFLAGNQAALMTETKYAEGKSFAVFNPLVYSIDTFTPIQQ